MSRAVIKAALAALVMAGCGADAEPEPEPTPQELVEVQEDTAVYMATPERETLPSHRIYYTLTQHAWYARGEPLLHDNRAWQAAGMPVAASASDMQLLGEYQGVEYYALGGDTASAVYVPVFEGYWQPFRPDTAQRVGS